MTVQYSIQKMVSDGTLSTIALGIQYLQRNDIYIRIAGVETPQSGAPSGYTWSFINNTTLKILPVVPNGVEVVVYRRTDVDAMYNIYSQNAQFDEATIDENNQQLLYIAQEYLEQGLPGAGIESLEYVSTAGGVNYYRFKLTDGAYTVPFGVPDGTVALRAELALGSGGTLVGFEQIGAGSIPRTVQVKLRERITPQDKGAVGDGVTNDTAAFVKLEEDHPERQEIDLLGKTYYVDAPFYGHKYYNGEWMTPSGASRLRWQGAQYTGAGRVVFGDGALASVPESYNMGSTRLVLALGTGAMGKMQKVNSAIAIGERSQGESDISRDNISIGGESLMFVSARTPHYDQSQKQGTRNVAIGGNSGRFIEEGWGNVAIGRNAGQCFVNIGESTVVGSGAAGGFATIGLSGVIENWSPNNDPSFGVTAFGSGALVRTITGFNVAVGQDAASSSVVGRGNTVVGPQAMRDAEKGLAFNGGIKTDLNIGGTYIHSGNALTINAVGHTVAVGDVIGLRLLDGGSQTFQGDIVLAYVVTVPNADSLTVNHPISRTASGSSTLYWKATGITGPKSELNTIVGGNAALNMLRGSENSVVGYTAMSDANSSVTDTSRNVAHGFRALTGWNTPNLMTAIGHDSLRYMQSGAVASGSGNNSSGLGAGTRVSGDNQVQLGNALTTTYVYGTVQNRSDARDKTDYDDTVLGIEFIMGLRPVDGRWDMRDDYLEEYQAQVGIDPKTAEPIFETRLRALPKDGSRARSRKHHWFIAQEVKELCDSLGVEFGGYQDHSVSGGCDVLSLGYDEFIPPTVKAVQQCWVRLDELEKRIEKLEI